MTQAPDVPGELLAQRSGRDVILFGRRAAKCRDVTSLRDMTSSRADLRGEHGEKAAARENRCP